MNYCEKQGGLGEERTTGIKDWLDWCEEKRKRDERAPRGPLYITTCRLSRGVTRPFVFAFSLSRWEAQITKARRTRIEPVSVRRAITTPYSVLVIIIVRNFSGQ